MCVSPYTTGSCFISFTYVDWYARFMHSKDISVGVETQDIVAYLLGMRKGLSVGKMLGGLLVPCNIHHTLDIRYYHT
jgi:hypothetical protein